MGITLASPCINRLAPLGVIPNSSATSVGLMLAPLASLYVTTAALSLGVNSVIMITVHYQAPMLLIATQHIGNPFDRYNSVTRIFRFHLSFILFRFQFFIRAASGCPAHLQPCFIVTLDLIAPDSVTFAYWLPLYTWCYSTYAAS